MLAIPRWTLVLLGLSWGVACQDRQPVDRLVPPVLRPLAPRVPRLLPAAAVTHRPPRFPGAFGRGDPAEGEARTLSVGTASRGHLRGGQPLLESPGLRPRPVSVSRRAVHGTAELVSLLARVGAQVERRWPGSVLYVGDLSAREGGDIPHHRSHNSGRDADLAFYTRSPGGRIADGPDLDHHGAHGSGSEETTRFDAARNWALVEALVRDAHVQVQWLFVAAHLEGALLEHARVIGVGADVLDRAARVMHQPSDSLAHDDHIHLRIYCSEADRLAGCVNDWKATEIRRRQPWVETHERAVLKRILQLRPLLLSGGSEEIAYAIERLVWLRRPEVIDDLVALKDHPTPSVAALASEAILFLKEGRSPTRWRWLTSDGAGE